MFETYNSLAEVPEAFRPHYVMKSGRAVPEVSTDHPLVTNNATLKTQKEEAERVKATAESEREEARRALASAKTIPHGQKAAPAAIIELGEAAKAAGIETVDAFTALKTKHDGLVKTEGVRARQDLMRELAKHAGYDPEKAALLLADNPDVPDAIEFRDGQNGKKEPWAKVKGAGDALEAKPWSEVVKGSPKLTALEASLSAGASSGGTRVPGSTGGSGKPPDNDKPLSDTTMQGWGPKKAAAA